MAAESLDQIQADLALDGLSKKLRAFGENALSSFTHGSGVSLEVVEGLLNGLTATLGEAKALRQSMAKSADPHHVPLNV